MEETTRNGVRVAIAGALLATVLGGALVAVGLLSGVSAQARARAVLVTVALAVTTVAFLAFAVQRLLARFAFISATHEGLVEELSQEFDKVNDRLHALESAVHDAPAATKEPPRTIRLIPESDSSMAPHSERSVRIVPNTK